MPAATPFTIAIEQSRLDDLSVRLRRTNLAADYANEEWGYGTNGAYLRELIDYWISGFDWRKQEAALNRLSHFRVTLDGIPIHFAVEKGMGPDPLPLVLTHGWPWTFWDFRV